MTTEAFERIAIAVRDANPDRNESNLTRRSLKLSEELGEVAEAYLNVTSASNGKGMTWDDVREEIADVLIVVLDIAWTPLTEVNKFAKFTFLPEHVRLPMMHPLIEHDILAVHCDFGRYLRIRGADDLIDLVEATVALNWAIMPDQVGIDEPAFEAQLEAEVARKLAKWSANRAKMTVVTDDV